jgi:predicted nuclease with RNAse H fold
MIGKQTGVAIPASQLREVERESPGKVLSVVPLHAVGVRYAREDGVVVKEVWYQAGDTFYVHPDSEQFTAKLAPIKDSYASQAQALLSAVEGSSNSIPVEDTVDVVSASVAEGV